MYVVIEGGEKMIANAHALQENRCRGDGTVAELSAAQIEQQMNLAVDWMMTKGGIADRELVVLALRQTSGDSVEAAFLFRAYRTTLAKMAVNEPANNAETYLKHRISAVYKDTPGGQLLGPTYDHAYRLLDFTLLANGETLFLRSTGGVQDVSPHVFSLLANQGLVKREKDDGATPGDITRTPPVYPCSHAPHLQQPMCGDEGYLLALAYSTQRGYGRNHPLAAEIRSDHVAPETVSEELGFAVNVGELLAIECKVANKFVTPESESPHSIRGYGLVFGMNECKAMVVALMDHALQIAEYDEMVTGPTQDEELVLAHVNNVEMTGSTSRPKPPHYVGFQAELESFKRLQQEATRDH